MSKGIIYLTPSLPNLIRLRHSDMIRRLAREAVIFMLVGMALAAVVAFVHLYPRTRNPQPVEVIRLDEPVVPAPTQRVGNLISAPAIPLPLGDAILSAILIGGYGFFGGFGLWIFYCLVRFAIRG